MKNYFLISLLLLTGCMDFLSTDTKGADGMSAAALLLLQPYVPAKPCSSYSPQFPAGVAGADSVVSAPASNGSGNSDSYCAVNGVRGGGNLQGSLDVFTLDITGSGASITLRWTGKKIFNGAGADFIVYENPFFISGSATNVYIEPVIVEVSQDNTVWCGFGPSYTLPGFSSDPANWTGFAALSPVRYNQESNPGSLAYLFTSGSTGGGGDFFDLASVVSDAGCPAGLVTNIQDTNTGNANRGFTYLRLTSATARTNPGTGNPYPGNANSSGGGPDIDGAAARYTY